MKNYLSLLLLWASLALVFSACSDNEKVIPEPEPSPVRVEPICWKVLDGDFLTREDVIVSEDSTSINVNKAYLDLLTGDDDIKSGDVMAVFTHGFLNYFQVEKAAENGDFYMSYTVKEVPLLQVLGICNIDVSNVKLSTDFWMDESLPRRVNNNGEADANGMMNTKTYVEHSADGSTIIHPAALLVPAHYEGMNADDENAVAPGAFVGCYIGMSDDYEEANGFFSSIGSAFKTVGKAIITPVVATARLAVDTGEMLAKLAVGGKYDKRYDVIDFDYDFMGFRWDILNRTRDRNESGENSKPLYAKEEWKSKIKPKIYATLDGHFRAHAGFLIGLDFKPLSVKRFEVGTYANLDIDLDAFIEAGVKIQAKRPISIKRFKPKQLLFDIGPVPVLIVIYPEIIWETKISSEILGYAHMTAKVLFDYDAIGHLYPKLYGEVVPKVKPVYDFKVHQVGFSGVGKVSTGPALRLSVELYGLAGPVIDIGHSINYKGNVDYYWDFDKEKTEEGKTENDIKGAILVDYRLGEFTVGGSIGFPPLKNISEYLYEKLAIDFGDFVKSPAIYRDTIFYHKVEPLPFDELWDEKDHNDDDYDDDYDDYDDENEYGGGVD